MRIAAPSAIALATIATTAVPIVGQSSTRTGAGYEARADVGHHEPQEPVADRKPGEEREAEQGGLFEHEGGPDLSPVRAHRPQGRELVVSPAHREVQARGDPDDHEPDARDRGREVHSHRERLRKLCERSSIGAVAFTTGTHPASVSSGVGSSGCWPTPRSA